MSDDRHPSPPRPEADEPIAYADWRTRKETREYVGARLMLIARGVVPGPNPVQQLAELEIIDIITGRGFIDDGRCPREGEGDGGEPPGTPASQATL